MNTVAAGGSSLIRVSLPVSSAIGAPVGGIWLTGRPAPRLAGAGAMAVGETGSAALLATMAKKVDPAAARIKNFRITNLLTQVALRKSRLLSVRPARSSPLRQPDSPLSARAWAGGG